MVGQITKADGTNTRTDGTCVPPVTQLKYVLQYLAIKYVWFNFSLIVVFVDSGR